MRRLARWVVPALLLAWWGSPALAVTKLPVAVSLAAASPGPAPSTEGRTANTGGPTTQDSTQARSYAAREAQAEVLERWQGGDGGVFIGGSALALLLVILLVILLIR